MEDLKKIQEFFSKPLEENLNKVAGGIPYKREGNKAIISMPLPDDAKARIIRRAKKHGYNAKPNMAGGVTIMAKVGESLNEGKQLDIVDFAKVVKAVTKTGHPVTVLLVPKWNEIEIITGMNAPDDMLFDLSNAVDSLGYGRNDIIIAADSSNLSRKEYSDIRRVNGGHKDYFEESVNELDAATYRSALEKGRSRGDSKGRGLATNALNLLAKKTAQTLVGQSFEVAGSKEKLSKGFYRGDSKKFINQFLMTFTGEGKLINPSKLDTVGSDEVHFNMKVEFQTPDNQGGWSTDLKFKGYNKYTFPGTVQFSIKEGRVWVWYRAAETDLEFTRAGARAIAKLADMVAQELQLKTPVKHNSIKQFDPMKPSVDEATKEEETEFHTKLDKLVHDTFGKRKGELEENALGFNDSRLSSDQHRDLDYAVRGDSAYTFGNDPYADDQLRYKYAVKMGFLEEYNTGIYYNPARDKSVDKSKEASKVGLEKVRDMIKKIMKEDLADYEEKDADYDKLYSDYLYKMVKEVATEKGYSKFLVSKDNPKGETSGLDTKTMNKILMNVIKDLDETIKLGKNLNEELCPKGKAYIKKRQAAGEKSSAYLSGRAVKVCKGQMKG